MRRLLFLSILISTVIFCTGCQSAPKKTAEPERSAAPAGAASTDALETLLHREINKTRRFQNRRTLKQDSGLALVARAHSLDMAQNQFFDHVNPAGELPTQRGLNRGYICRIIENGQIREGIAENIFKTSLYHRYTVRGQDEIYEWRTAKEIARSTIKQWLNSPGHAHNLLNNDFVKSGIGVAKTEDNQILITQDFC